MYVLARTSKTIASNIKEVCDLLKNNTFLLHSLSHPVVLNVPVEGNLVADIDVDGVALHAFLLLFLFFRAEVEVCGSTPLP